MPVTKLAKDIAMLTHRRGALKARDGAIIDPIVDDANGIQWFFQYRKYSKSFWKWYAVGQQQTLWSPAGIAVTPTPINTDSITGAAVTAPFSGEYMQTIRGLSSSSAASQLWFRSFLDGVTLTDGWIYNFAAAGNFPFELNAVFYRELLAQHVFQLGAQVTVLGPTIGANHLFGITPRRIAI